MKCIIILATLVFIDSVHAYFLTKCNSQEGALHKLEEISSPILYSDVESILRVLGEPQYKYVSGVRELLQFYEEAKLKKEQFETPGNVTKHPLIVLEGLSGSGKTTLAAGLLNKINCTQYHSPPVHIQHLNNLFRRNVMLNNAYTFLAQYIASFDVGILITYSPVIMDRYWYSCSAFAIAYAVNNFPEKYSMPSKGNKIYSWPEDLLKPDVIFLLDVDESIRQHRLNKRNNSTRGALDDFMSRCPQFSENLLSAYKNMNNPEVIVINANQSVDEVLEDVYSKIKQLVTI